MLILIELIGWAATIFRSWGMLCKNTQAVKWLVTIGNFLWMISGILTQNIPLIASNGICLAIMLIDQAGRMRKKDDESQEAETYQWDKYDGQHKQLNQEQ